MTTTTPHVSDWDVTPDGNLAIRLTNGRSVHAGWTIGGDGFLEVSVRDEDDEEVEHISIPADEIGEIPHHTVSAWPTIELLARETGRFVAEIQ